MSESLPPNKLFYNFLAYMKPELSQAFRRRGEVYETYPSLEKEGHKFIFDPKKMEIVHLLYRPVFFGSGYEKRLDREIFLVEKTQKGFKINKKKASPVAA